METGRGPPPDPVRRSAGRTVIETGRGPPLEPGTEPSELGHQTKYRDHHTCANINIQPLKNSIFKYTYCNWCVVVVVVNILFQTKKDTLMIGHCTALTVIATKTLAGKK